MKYILYLRKCFLVSKKVFFIILIFYELKVCQFLFFSNFGQIKEVASVNHIINPLCLHDASKHHLTFLKLTEFSYNLGF